MSGKYLLFLLLASTILAQDETVDAQNYFEAVNNYQILRSLAEPDDSLSAELSTLERAAESAVQDSLYQTAIDFIYEANALLESVITIRDSASLPPQLTGTSFSQTSSVSLFSGYSHYGTSLFSDSASGRENDWSTGTSWNYGFERRSPVVFLEGRNFLWINNDLAQNRIYGKAARTIDSIFTFFAIPELAVSMNMPHNPWKDSTNGMIARFSTGGSWLDRLTLTAGAEEALYKHQMPGYANYFEPWGQVDLTEQALPVSLHTYAGLKYSTRRYLSSKWKKEGFDHFQSRLGVRFLPLSKWNLLSYNFMDARAYSKPNHAGDYFFMENNVSLQRELSEWLTAEMETRAEHSYFVAADSLGGYRYFTRSLSILPAVTVRTNTNFSIFAQYDFLVSINRGGPAAGSSTPYPEDFQVDGLKLEIRWFSPKMWMTLSNDYRYHESAFEETFTNPDEISNRTSLYTDFKLTEKWSLSLTNEWRGRWQHAGAQSPDLILDARLSCRLK